MKKILTLLLLIVVAAGGVQAEDLIINVKAYWKNEGRRVPLAGVHVYRVTSNGKRVDYAQTYSGGDLMNGKHDERIRTQKVGFLTFECIVWDAARFENGEFVFPNQKTAPESKKTIFTLDCSKIKGNEYTKEVEITPVDVKDFKFRMGEARTTATLRVGTGFAPEGDDGARVGEYETFGVRFLVPKDSLKSNQRIVAQPVWIDKTAGLTYYGDPLVYYGKDYYRMQLRESAYSRDADQEGLPFYDGAPRTKGEAYAKEMAISDDLLHDYTLTDRDELHYAKKGGQKDDDNLYFRLPFYIKVDERMASNDCAALVKWVVTDYDSIVSEHCDTIIEGRSDPLRFLRYDVGGFLDESGNTDADRYWFPERIDGAHEAACDLKIFYETGQTAIDWSNPTNAAERERALKNIRDVMNIADADVREVEVVGYASPDGKVSTNERLAAGRVQSFRSFLSSEMGRVDRYTRSRAEIASWASVADTLRTWGMLDGEYGDPVTEGEIRSKVDETTLKRALDAVRVTRFNIKYEITAAYTDEELLAKYEEQTVSQEFMYRSVYRYLAQQGDWEGAEKVCREIYDKKKDFHKKELAELDELMNDTAKRSPEDSIAANRRISILMSETHDLLLYSNDLCAILLHRGVGDTTLLKKYLVAPNRTFRDTRRNVLVHGVPDMVLLNQAAAYLLNKKYSYARGLVNFYRSKRNASGGAETESIKLIGDLIDANKEVKREHVESLGRIDPLNKVVCTLALRDATAEELRQAKMLALDTAQISDTVAVNNIVRALCYGRDYGRRNGTYKVTDYYDTDLTEGAEYLLKALEQDRSLYSMAYAQRDLKPLFKVVDRIRRDREVIKNVKVTRKNRAKEIR